MIPTNWAEPRGCFLQLADVGVVVRTRPAPRATRASPLRGTWGPAKGFDRCSQAGSFSWPAGLGADARSWSPRTRNTLSTVANSGLPLTDSDL